MQMQLFDLVPSQEPLAPEHKTLGHYASMFLAHCRNAKSLSSHTLRAYQGDIGLLVRDVGSDAEPTAIDRDRLWQHVRWLREDRRLGEASVKRRLATLRIFFRWLEAEGVVPISAFHRLGLAIRLPKRLPRALNEGDLRRLLDVVDPPGYSAELSEFDDLLIRTIVVVLFATGLRVSELVSIEVANVSEIDASILVRGKGNRERRVYLADGQASEALADYLNRTGNIRGRVN